MMNVFRAAKPSGAKLLTLAGVTTAAALAIGSWLRQCHERKCLLRAGVIRPLQSTWYDVDGLRIHARVSEQSATADRDPVILIHGLGVSSTYFIPSAERLALRFAVFTPDLPGHGQSAVMSSHPNIEGLAEFALRWMSAAGISRAAIVGHSMGCQVAIEIALREPDRVSRLVLAAPTPDPQARSVPDQFWRLLVGTLFERTALTIIVLKDYLRMGARFVPEFYAMLRYPTEKKLPFLTVPTVVIRGENDPVVPQRWAEEAASLVANKHVLVIPGWGHAVQYSAAPEFVEAIVPFLSRNSVEYNRA
jgi:2-hydroxy-6-oxonona-2,4-dienedioate hydrolase